MKYPLPAQSGAVFTRHCGKTSGIPGLYAEMTT
jgi:hypothetical protein